MKSHLTTCPDCHDRTTVSVPDEADDVTDFANERADLRGDPGHGYEDVECDLCENDFWVAYRTN